MKKISAVIITKNEEKNISRCLDSVRWCDEIIIVDDYSSDNTQNIAMKYGVKLYKRKLKNFSDQRNYAIKKASFDWILFIDADEVISKNLSDEIRDYIEDDSISGLKVTRVDYMWGKKLTHGESYNFKITRVCKKNNSQWIGNVHEVLQVNGMVENLKNPLLHFPHQKVSDFLSEINFYSSLRAQELYHKKISVNGLDIIFLSIAKFKQNYILKLGFLDSLPGLIHAIMMSFYTFQVRSKLYLLWKKG